MALGEVASAGLGAAGNVVSGLIGQLFAGANDRRRAGIDEFRGALNATNDFEKFLAQMQATNPTKSVDDFVSARARANILAGPRGTGVDFGEMRGDPKVKNVKSREERLAADPMLASIVSTLNDPGKSNLNQNAQTGLLDFIKPQLELAASGNIAQGGKFKQGGVTKTFGAANSLPRPAQPKTGGDGFTEFLQGQFGG